METNASLLWTVCASLGRGPLWVWCGQIQLFTCLQIGLFEYYFVGRGSWPDADHAGSGQCHSEGVLQGTEGVVEIGLRTHWSMRPRSRANRAPSGRKVSGNNKENASNNVRVTPQQEHGRLDNSKINKNIRYIGKNPHRSKRN
ncbi:hypothetical protein EVAR_94350_1 [Eumeta japonica]|uniref:Uncharacterized protein n=1 Tax=Eumeta variegata TaxID=151549 RepID=A0A4C1TPV0_EUMVA|nr:hypothetical protein EVAR_94350_1 [Eumeta japonica]